MLGVEDTLRRPREELCEHALAFGKRRPAQIEPIEIEQVERVVKQPVLRPAARSA